MHSQYLWNVANRGQIRLTCMQVRPLLIILIPLLENIMCGKTEGSASPNAHSVFRVWRPLLKGPWHSWNPSSAQEPRRLSQVPSSALVPRLRKAQGSQQHQGFSVPAWTVLCRAWLPATTLQRNLLQKILALHKLVSKRACWHQESGGSSTAQKAATSLYSGWQPDSKFIGVLHTGYSQIPFSLQETGGLAQ